jgi:hypothetical protein
VKRKAHEEYQVASDGLPARRNGAWARDKLSFFDEFLPPALQATNAPHQSAICLGQSGLRCDSSFDCRSTDSTRRSGEHARHRQRDNRQYD